MVQVSIRNEWQSIRWPVRENSRLSQLGDLISLQSPYVYVIQVFYCHVLREET